MKIENGVLQHIASSDIINGKLTIPNGVVTIGDRVLYECPTITDIVLPETLKTIGKQSFAHCENLANITLPESLETIDEDAFASCTALNEINLPNGLKAIKNNAFHNSGLTHIVLPNSIKIIEDKVFAYCSKLKSLTIPKNIKTLGDSCFFACNNLEDVFIEDGGLKKIDQFAFSACSNLKNITLPTSLDSIENLAFSQCHKLSNITIPKNVKTIGNSVFYQTALKSIIIPESVENLGKNVFYDCKELQTAIISNKIKILKSGTFEKCSNLKSVKLPHSLKKIENSAFSACNKLVDIDIPESVEFIDSYAFSECNRLKNVKLPENLVDLGSNVFEKCSQLQSIEIPDSIQFLRNNVFKDCIDLRFIKLSKNLAIIGDSTFNGCTELKKIELPKSLSEIGESAFECCFSLKNIKFPEKLKIIGKHAFNDCFSIEEIEFPNNLTTLGEYAFSGTALKSIKLPESLNSVGDFLFFSCSSLENVELPENLKIITTGMFQKCKNLKNICIPKSVKKIEKYALSETDLNEIIVPNGVDYIGYGAFSSNKNLEHITIPEGVKTIRPQAFDGNEKLQSLHIPNSVTSDLGYIRSTFNFFEKNDNGFSLSKEQSKNSLPISSIKLNLPFLSRHWDKKDLLFREQNNNFICNFYNDFLSQKPETDIQQFLNSHNFTFFKKLNLADLPEYKFQLYNSLYNLGAVSVPIERNGKKIDYAQKVCEYLIQQEKTSNFSVNNLRQIFKTMEQQGFKPEFTDFFLKDFEQLLKVNSENDGFIARCYNEFEKVQKTNTNHHGSQRQLKPTIEKFQDYFEENKFFGVVDEKTQKISDTISPYFNSQEIFDLAIKITKEKESSNVPNNILSYHLKEKYPFENIDKLSSKIKDLQKDTLANLTSTATNEFTFDWLEKNDPENFILGNLCSCCAHLDGAGYGIMRASIIHPNVQNLVIRNKDGEIIAKSTLFINPNEGYGVFNNVEVNTQINFTNADKQKIYDKYIQGISRFAEEYNKEHPTTKLKQINVGMNLNDLTKELQKNSTKSSKIFVALNYGKYGRKDHLYSGDSELEQYVVWKDKSLDLENEKQ